MPGPRLSILACGWDHDAWQPVFYPDDLPPEWRLTFFANEFPGVFLPCDYWAPRRADLAAWADEVAPGFRFYLERPAALPAAAPLPARCWGGWWSAAPEPGGGVIALRPADREAPAGAALRIVSEALGDLRAQRTLLERIAAATPATATRLLVVDGAPPDYPGLMRLRELARLLGLA